MLLDLDNHINKQYVNRLYRISRWESEAIYYPSFAKPRFDFRRFSGKRIDMMRVKELPSVDNSKFVTTSLNTGNYLAPTSGYVCALREHIHVRVNAVDVLAANYFWLKQGGKLGVVSGLAYEHAVHAESHYAGFQAEGKMIAKGIRKAITNGTDLDLERLVERANVQKKPE